MACTNCHQSGHNCAKCPMPPKPKPKPPPKPKRVPKPKPPPMQSDVPDIWYFEPQAGNGRGTNDIANAARERVIMRLVLPETSSEWQEYAKDPNYCELRESFWNAAKQVCVEPFDSIKLQHRGTRRNNHDYEIEFYLNGSIVYACKLEFKCSAKTIDGSPEYLSMAANKYVGDKLYAEYYYETYIDKICALSTTLSRPSKDVYLKHIHTADYGCDPFFEELYRLKKSDTHIQKELSRFVNESIASYLNTQVEFDLDAITQDIKQQNTKTFVLWDPKTRQFSIDRFAEDELNITGIKGLKNKNSIVLTTACKSEHHVLLRWKNNNGVLFPAWQIKLTRSKWAGKPLAPFSRVHCSQRNSQ